MKEIDPKYNELIKQTYPELVVDYVLLENDAEYKGEESHKEAVKLALSILSKRDVSFVIIGFLPVITVILLFECHSVFPGKS